MLPETSIVYTKEHLIILIYYAEHLKEEAIKKGEGEKEVGGGASLFLVHPPGTPRTHCGPQQRARVRHGAEPTSQPLPGHFTV